LYTIRHTEDPKQRLDFVKLEGNGAYAKIHLNLGGSLQELIIDGHQLIEDLDPLTYDYTYASSILFPFSNRIADGMYSFKGERYQLEVNQTEENNALHGLIYDKPFKLVEQNCTEREASLVLRYEEVNQAQGFPYTYTVELKYVLTKGGLSLRVSVKNTDAKTFPFTIGWHPYFVSRNLSTSSVHFKSKKAVLCDERKITLGLNDIDIDDKVVIANKTLDDCYVLDFNEVKFETPNHSFVLSSTEKESFLHLYTPKRGNTIAIEPTTGISNSFNNGVGLKELEPNDEYTIIWNIAMAD
jgi:aldose 1-epimerase